MEDYEALAKILTSLPLDKVGIVRAKKAIANLRVDQLERLGLGPPPAPRLPDNVHLLKPRDRLQAIQAYISAFRYNYVGGYHFNIHKRRPLNQIMNTARNIARDNLPIKCIEATFLGLLLTCRYPEWQRFPVGFKTRVQGSGQVFRHIVLLVFDQDLGAWGALGLSRRADLMFKPLSHPSLSAIVSDFRDAYAAWAHQLLKVRVGLPVEHNVYSTAEVCWRYCNVNARDKQWRHVAALLDTFAASAKALAARYRATGQKRRLTPHASRSPTRQGHADGRTSDGHSPAKNVSPTRLGHMAARTTVPGSMAALCGDYRGASGTDGPALGGLPGESSDDSDSGSEGPSTPLECSDSEDEVYARLRRLRDCRQSV